MEDVFFIIGSSLNISQQVYKILEPENVRVVRYDSFDDFSNTSNNLLPSFVLIENVLLSEIDSSRLKKLKDELDAASIFLILSDEKLSSASQTNFMNSGFDGFLSKDVDPSYIFAYLKSLFRLFNRSQQKDSNGHKYRLLFETMFSAYALHEMITDERGNPINYRYLEVNPAFERITGYKAEEVVGKTFLDLFPDSNRAIIEKYGEVALGGKRVQFEQHSPDMGKYFEVVAFSPIKGQFSTVFIDITEYKEAIKIIKDSENSLKEMNEAKDRFFSIVAHDLKNPFHNIMGFADLLVTDFKSFTESEALEHITHIKTATENAYTLLMNLLDWSRVLLDRIDVQAESTNVSLLVEEALKVLGDQADSKHIKLLNDIKPETLVFADHYMIGTVIRNLVSNAIKFSNDHQSIRIESQDLGKLCQISIVDEGVGISPDKIERVFSLDKHKSTLGTAKEKGTGLGLILCKEFIEKNKGKIWVESSLGMGTTFHFILPKTK